MIKLYYNIQLLSSFLLDKTRFLFILFILLLNGNTLFSLVFCEEQIENIQLKQESQENQSNNTNMYIGFAIALAVSIFLAYLYLSGGDAGDSAASLAKNISQKPKPILEGFEVSPEAYIRVSQNLVEGYKHKVDVVTNENIKLALENQNLTKEAKVNLDFAKHLAIENKNLGIHVKSLENQQTSLYNFLMEIFVKHPETQEEITRFTRENPPIAPYKSK